MPGSPECTSRSYEQMSTAETPENKPEPEDEATPSEMPEEQAAPYEETADEIPEEVYEQHEGPSSDGPAARIAALEQELSDSRDQMLRALAEQENTRKRLLKDREDLRKYANADRIRSTGALSRDVSNKHLVSLNRFEK